MKKPKLNFTQHTEEDLDRLSEVTEQDIIDTNQTIVQAVSDRFKNLVTAVRVQLFGDENGN
mgnify:CR=1 FL=1